MFHSYFKNSFDAILEDIKEEPFYIFGLTTHAHVFYLYCKEKRVENQIKAFILSDLKRDPRKLHFTFGIPVKDIKWLKENEKVCKIFLGGREDVVERQLLKLLEEQNIPTMNVYYVSDFVNSIMHWKYLSYFYENVSKRYHTFKNRFDGAYINMTDIGSQNFYKYMEKVSRGLPPDIHIFGEGIKLDELHHKQLGNYQYISKIEKSQKNDKSCKIYAAKSHVDQNISEEFETPCTEMIQVGAALTNQEISVIKDNTGDNISLRNRDYCELSALYWAWKNDKNSDYIGLCHYRRRFVIDESALDYIISNDFDAVYTIPKLTDGGMRMEFVERKYYLTPEMWELTDKAIHKLSPEYIDAWKEFEQSYLIISCNMFIMRRDILEDYCSWSFSILEEVDRYYKEKGIQCDNRYLGYIGECLTTVYAMKHKDTLKKAYVELKMLTS